MSTDSVSDAGGLLAARRQLTVFLLRKSVARVEDAVQAEKAGDPIDMREIPKLKGQIYVASSSSDDTPWAAFLRGIAASAKSIPALPSQSHSAVLIVQYRRRFFAVVFGHGRYLLKPEAIERNYGLKSAAGLVNPELVQTIESLVADSAGLRVRRQVNEGTHTSRLGLEIEH